MTKMKQTLAVILSCICSSVTLAAPKISEVVERMKSATRPIVEFSSDSTVLDMALYFREWAREAGIDDITFNLEELKNDKGDVVYIHVGECSYFNQDMYSVLEKCCNKCLYFFTIRGNVVTIAPNLPKYIESRKWTNRKGKKINAKWIGSAKGDHNHPIFQLDGSEKRIKIDLDKLVEKDRKYLLTSRLRDQKLPYVYIDGDWLSPLEIHFKEKSEREERYIRMAKDIIKSRSYHKATRYKVLQALEFGALCVMNSDPHNPYNFNGELFFDVGLSRGCTADDDIYNVKYPLYWVGTYTYDTVSYGSKTINAYEACTLDKAIFMVRMLQGYHDADDERFVSSSEEEIKPKRKSNDGSLQLASYGSGFFITPDGYFVTNYHVVEGARKIVLSNGKDEYIAKVIRVDKDVDLALLKVEGDFEYLEMSPARNEPLGKSIFTMGYPQPDLQGTRPKVTKGVISGDEGFRGDVRRYQIDASIQPGNSGGPVVDDNGYLVGVVVSRLINGQNVNYAIKKSYLLAFLDSTPDCSGKISSPSTEKNKEFLDAVEHVKLASALVKVYE